MSTIQQFAALLILLNTTKSIFAADKVERLSVQVVLGESKKLRPRLTLVLGSSGKIYDVRGGKVPDEALTAFVDDLDRKKESEPVYVQVIIRERAETSVKTLSAFVKRFGSAVPNTSKVRIVLLVPLDE